METHGDVTGEYLALRRDAGLVTGQHELVWAVGRDSVSFLQDLLTQELASRPVGDVSRSLLLSPRGKLRALLWVLRGEDRVGMLADRGTGEAVVEDLTRFRIRVDVTLQQDRRPVSELWGAKAADVLTGVGLSIPDGWIEATDGVVVVSMPLGNLPRFALLGIDESRLEAGGARRAGTLATTAVRVEGGEPQMTRDVDERTIPQEAGLAEEAISFEKGCYLGQELVARIDSRGHVNRILRGIAVAENVVPPEGAEVVADDVVVGVLTSVAESLTLRAPVGLALVRREVEPGDSVTVRWPTGQARARVGRLPMDDFTS